jgi:hypothetical protein
MGTHVDEVIDAVLFEQDEEVVCFARAVTDGVKHIAFNCECESLLSGKKNNYPRNQFSYFFPRQKK